MLMSQLTPEDRKVGVTTCMQLNYKYTCLISSNSLPFVVKHHNNKNIVTLMALKHNSVQFYYLVLWFFWSPESFAPSSG